MPDKRQRASEQVVSAQRLINALRKDVASFRQENKALRKDRDLLTRNAAMLDASRLELREARGRWQQSQAEQKRLEALVEELAEDNASLQRQVEELDAMLTREREGHDEARGELRLLRAQIKELETIVDLLRAQQVD